MVFFQVMFSERHGLEPSRTAVAMLFCAISPISYHSRSVELNSSWPSKIHTLKGTNTFVWVKNSILFSNDGGKCLLFLKPFLRNNSSGGIEILEVRIPIYIFTRLVLERSTNKVDKQISWDSMLALLLNQVYNSISGHQPSNALRHALAISVNSNRLALTNSNMIV